MQLASFNVVGISVKTTNAKGQMGHDIPALWQRFFNEDIANAVPHKVDATIYSVYTHYEGGFTQPYTVVLGYKVPDLKEIPEGMVGIEVPKGKYTLFTAKGNLNEGVVYETWKKIWETPLERAYQADFEVYGEKAQNPENAEVEIFIGVK